MRYINIIGLVLLISLNLHSLLTSSHSSIGIGTDGGKMYAVGMLDDEGKKCGYWHYLSKNDDKYLTRIIGHFKNDLPDSLWVQYYDDVYPYIKQSFYMYNDTVRGYIYQYDKRGHFERLDIYYRNGASRYWEYYNDVCTGCYYETALTCAHSLMEQFIRDMKYEKLDYRAPQYIKYNVCILAILLLANIINIILPLFRTTCLVKE